MCVDSMVCVWFSCKKIIYCLYCTVSICFETEPVTERADIYRCIRSSLSVLVFTSWDSVFFCGHDQCTVQPTFLGGWFCRLIFICLLHLCTDQQITYTSFRNSFLRYFAVFLCCSYRGYSVVSPCFLLMF